MVLTLFCHVEDDWQSLMGLAQPQIDQLGRAERGVSGGWPDGFGVLTVMPIAAILSRLSLIMNKHLSTGRLVLGAG